MPGTYGSVCDAARALLDDRAGNTYSDDYLLPLMNVALDVLVGRLCAESCTQVVMVTVLADVPAGTSVITTATTPALPSGLIAPRNLKCMMTGNGEETWGEVLGPKSFVVPVQPGSLVTRWNWTDSKLFITPASVICDIRLEYNGDVARFSSGPSLATTAVPIAKCDGILATLLAGLAALSKGQVATAGGLGVPTERGITGAAGGMLADFIATQTKIRQSAPVRRNAYRPTIVQRYAR